MKIICLFFFFFFNEIKDKISINPNRGVQLRTLA